MEWERVEDAVEQLLEAYGLISVYEGADQTGAAMVGEEIKQLEKMSGVIPLLFLSVAAVVLYITLSRMTEQQRTQIGTMMALGISKWQIRFHYLFIWSRYRRGRRHSRNGARIYTGGSDGRLLPGVFQAAVRHSASVGRIYADGNIWRCRLLRVCLMD